MVVYLNNVYGDQEIESWFTTRYRASGKRLDMGKSCVRFRKLDNLPIELIGEAVARTSVDAYIAMYVGAKRGTEKGDRPQQADGAPAGTRTRASGLGNRCSIRLSYRGTLEALTPLGIVANHRALKGGSSLRLL